MTAALALVLPAEAAWSPAVALAAATAGASVALVMPLQPSLTGAARRALGSRVSPPPHQGRSPADGPGHIPPGEPDFVARHSVVVSLLAGAAPLLLVGGVAGLASAVVLVVVVHRFLTSREPASERRRREVVARDLPHVVDLIAVSLAAGADPASAVDTVAAAVEGPVATELRAAHRSLALGRDPARVWQEVARRPGVAPLGRALTRALETGAPVSEALHRLSEDLHAAARAEAEGRARAVGVKAAAPLGVCLLPAFILVGIVPLVAGTFTALLR